MQLEIMKNFFILTIINLLFITCKSQQVYDLCTFDNTIRDGRYYKDLQGNLNPFTGTWKNVTGNKTLKIILWKVEKEEYNGNYFMDGIHGDYEMIENEGQPNEIILYKSKKLIGNTGQYFTPAIVVRGSCRNSIGGVIMDNRAMTITNVTYVTGNLSFSLITNNTAHWKIDIQEGIRIQGRPTFQLPMDLVMTKQ